MNLSVVLAYAAACVTAGMAAFALWRDPRSFSHRVFTLGMALLAADVGLTGFAFQSASPEAFLFRQRLSLIIASFLPAVWIVFSLTFARVNYREQIAKWGAVLVIAFLLPISLVLFFPGSFFAGYPVPLEGTAIFSRIGRSGYAWHILWIISDVMILMNLERTFRHATGHMRWQTKFMFLGIGGFFAVHLFSDSQAILFKGIDTGLANVNLGALLLADLLIFQSLLRGKPLHAGIQLSHQFLYSSFTLLVVGVYFIAVASIAWLSVHFGMIRNIHVAIFLIFVAIVGIAALLLSDRLRIQRKRFISRHFRRPLYDYREIWNSFTKKTTSVTQTGDLCNIVVRMVSETLEILSVSIWLVDEKQERLLFGGSTVFTEEQAGKMSFYGQGGAELIRAMSDQVMPLDLEGRSDDWVEDLKSNYAKKEAKESLVRYCVPLSAAGTLIGIMTLSEKVYYQPLSFEESELLRIIADQAAAGLLNLRFSEKLRQTKELEAFQAMSAFFMHDLKNLASKLSLVTQNLPLHIDNPEFRVDALKTISQSVAKINAMSGRLSLLSQKLEISLRDADLNDLVRTTVSELKDLIRVSIVQNLAAVPKIMIDPEQIRKVLENLIMNAGDAMNGRDGNISVKTAGIDQWVELSVADNGVGMSGEFIKESLFRPFQTTKQHGMGIGLYHCKTIIEAHGGRIEAESEEGKGATIRVFLPLHS